MNDEEYEWPAVTSVFRFLTLEETDTSYAIRFGSCSTDFLEPVARRNGRVLLRASVGESFGGYFKE